MRNYVDGIGTRSLDNFSNRTIRLERLTLVQIKYGTEEIQSSLILSTIYNQIIAHKGKSMSVVIHKMIKC